MSDKLDRPVAPEVFDRALQRAVELDAERQDALTEDQLVEAGHELGIAEPVTRAALAEVQARQSTALARVHPRPFDTAIVLDSSPTELRLVMPAPGPLAHLGKAFGASVSLAIATCLTWMLWHGTSWVVLPAVIAAYLFALMFGVAFVGQAWTAFELRLDAAGSELLTRIKNSVVTERVEPRHLRAFWKEEQTKGSGKSSHTTPAHLALEYGTKTHKLMSGRSEAELRWVQEELEAWLEANGR